MWLLSPLEVAMLRSGHVVDVVMLIWSRTGQNINRAKVIVRYHLENMGIKSPF